MSDRRPDQWEWLACEGCGFVRRVRVRFGYMNPEERHYAERCTACVAERDEQWKLWQWAKAREKAQKMRAMVERRRKESAGKPIPEPTPIPPTPTHAQLYYGKPRLCDGKLAGEIVHVDQDDDGFNLDDFDDITCKRCRAHLIKLAAGAIPKELT